MNREGIETGPVDSWSEDKSAGLRSPVSAGGTDNILSGRGVAEWEEGEALSGGAESREAFGPAGE